MIVQVFSLFDQSGPFVERAAKSLRILADKTGERILAKDHYCIVKVRLFGAGSPDLHRLLLCLRTASVQAETLQHVTSRSDQ